MLILTRRDGESLKIGDAVTITVLGIRGNEVRIGVTAPRAIPVHREEVYVRIQAEKVSMAANETGAGSEWSNNPRPSSGW